MKISNSKQQLAKIINENDGWIAGGFAAQQDDGEVWFSGVKPVWKTRCGSFDMTYEGHFTIGHLIANRHQTILSRDEYFHLYPAPDADGWIEYCGTERPLGVFAEIVDVRLYDGRVLTDSAGRFEWHTDGNARIVAYRLSKPEQAKSAAVGDDENSMAAKEELEALEIDHSKPTIEQLAADYKAKLAIAQQAQEEADSHRCGAEAALEKIVAAGKALGLVLSVEDLEPELVITDWRDLLPGDEVEYVHGWQPEDFGRIGVVDRTEFDESSPNMNVRLMLPNGHSGWPVEWRFIRRP